MGSYEKAIIKTLSYALVFHFPLTRSELWRFLLWERKKTPQISAFLKELNWLIKEKKISQIKNFYLLKKYYPWVEKRIKGTKTAKQKILIAVKVAGILKIIPTIVFIGLSGKLAMGMAAKEDDIDLLIITRSGYLWLTRLVVIAILSFLGIRRKPDDSEAKNKICVNMFLDLNHLNLPKKERDIFSAHEITQLKPLYDKDNSYQEFLKKNQWLGKFLPNAIREVPQVPKVLKVPQVKNTFFEQIARKTQLWYMRKRRSREVIREGYLRFHPQDAREWILPKYHENLKYHGYHE
ncbi:MAG: hypothetical protein M1426_00855 [Patescibacteria group bacterium]|nr:hypothetical protein [Patescibacteria group bacterium]